MAVLIGALILVLLIMGLVNRKRRNQDWVKEERYEESGNWIDKRPGERGSRGSLDEEMAQERGQLVRQGRAVELAELIREYANKQWYSIFSLPEDQRLTFRKTTLAHATRMVAQIEKISRGQMPAELPATKPEHTESLKKQILDFAYRHYPALLDLDIDTLRRFDALTAGWAEMLLKDAKNWKE